MPGTPGGDTRRASGGRRGSVAVQQAVQVVKVLQHDEDMDDSDKKWYQKVSWVCIGFVMLLAVLCGYAYVDVNTVKTTKADNVTVEETLSEENGVYVNLVVGVILVFTQYCLLAMCFLSFVGWLFGRKRWWAGPYCTGFIGFGDGSAAEVPPERLLKSWGISTVSEDLYFDEEVDPEGATGAPRARARAHGLSRPLGRPHGATGYGRMVNVALRQVPQVPEGGARRLWAA